MSDEQDSTPPKAWRGKKPKATDLTQAEIYAIGDLFEQISVKIKALSADMPKYNATTLKVSPAPFVNSFAKLNKAIGGLKKRLNPKIDDASDTAAIKKFFGG